MEEKEQMYSYLAKEMENPRGVWKKKLLYWGGTMEICKRKQAEIQKLIALKKENERVIEDEYWEIAEKLSERYTREIERIQAEIDEVLEKKAQMDSMIACMSPEEQNFIFLRFSKGYGYDYIALKLHQSRANCFRMQDRILKYFIAWEEGEKGQVGDASGKEVDEVRQGKQVETF